jgi:hypothetical protein
MDAVVVAVEALTLSFVISQTMGAAKAGDDFHFVHEGNSWIM